MRQALATLFFLDAHPSQLQAAYNSMNADLGPWGASPTSIADEETKSRLLGDTRHDNSLPLFQDSG